jgi:putative hydrolase of the HAD superfamily
MPSARPRCWGLIAKMFAGHEVIQRGFGGDSIIHTITSATGPDQAFCGNLAPKAAHAIVYDAVGTLIHVQPSVAHIYAAIGQRFGSRLTIEQINGRFRAAFARQERLDRDMAWRTDETRERQRWCDIVAEVLDDVADAAGCFEALFEAFGKADAWACDADAAAVIATLQTRGVKQAVASNFDGRLRGMLEAMPGLDGLTPIIISSEVGWRKPAPEFFAHLLQKLQLPARDVLFVGDDRGNDFEAARGAGMWAVLLDPARKHLDVAARLERLRDLLCRV